MSNSENSEKTYYIIVDGQDIPVKTEGRECVFSTKEGADSYLSFYPDGEHRIDPKNSTYLETIGKDNIWLDPPTFD